MTDVQDSFVHAYSYPLPPEQVAQRPCDRRDSSRLLLVDRGPISRPRHHRFHEVAELLQPGDLLVVNDTRVRPARLFGRKAETGGGVELLALRDLGDGSWEGLVRPSAKVRPGTDLVLHRRPCTAGTSEEADPTRSPAPSNQATGADLSVGEEFEGGSRRLIPRNGADVPTLLDRFGEMPLPPYIDRKEGPVGADWDRYQCVFAREDGAVAAPTAGLHFTAELLDRLRTRGVEQAAVTLQVGPGTFQPVRTEQLCDHPMHSEYYCVPKTTAEAVEACLARGNRIVAVGTTSYRSLESWHREGHPHDGGVRETRLFLHPGAPAELPMDLITNFHLPESTLVMLVASLLGRERALALYQDAIAAAYRFYSYGDAMLIQEPRS